MLSNSRQYFAPPIFEGDAEKTRIAALLNSILLITLGINFFLNPVLILVVANPIPSLVVDGGLLVTQIGLWFLMRRGYVRVASISFCVAVWVYVSFVSLTFGGFNSLLPAGYIVLVFVAGILLGRFETYGFWGLSLLGIGAIAYVEINNRLPPPLVPTTPMYKGLVISSILFAMVALLGITLSSITKALAQARREIAERQRVEQELRANSVQLRRLTDNMMDMITEIDVDVTTQYISPSVERLLGYRPADMLGRNALELIHPDDLPQVVAILQADYTARVPAQIAYRYRHADGHYLWLESVGTVLANDGGEVIGAVLSTRDITERRKIEQALRVSEERLRQAVRAGNIGIFDHDHLTDVIYWSPEQRNNYAWGAEETVTLAAFLAQVYADDREKIGAAVQRAHDPMGDGLFDVEHRIIRRDGAVRWLTTRSQTFFEGEADARRPVRTVGAVADITEPKRAEAAVHESREQFSSAFEYAPIGMALVHPDHHIMQANRALGQMLGYSSAELIGQYFRDLTHPDDVAQSVENNRRLFEGEQAHYRFEKRYVHRQGHVIWALLSVSVVKGFGGEPRYAIAQIQDITERKMAEANLHRLNDELERRVSERTVELEAANRDLESFSYSVSHDLRAPLRSIDGFARILVEGYALKLDADGRRLLERVCTSARHMGQLIDDLLAFSRLGRQPIRKQTIDPAKLVRQLLDELKADYGHRQVEIVVGELPACDADPALVRQVFANLLGNAIKYSSKRERARIEVGWTGEVYFVRDNGAGFDMNYADKLFGVFQRLHTESEFEGTGVGLAIVKRIVERHGGRIWAEAAEDKGATFFFTLRG